jgi:hypothetical protein
MVRTGQTSKSYGLIGAQKDGSIVRTLSMALLGALLVLCCSACAGGGSPLPAVSSPATKVAAHSKGVTRNDCTDDTGGIMTGDDSNCVQINRRL